MFYFKSTGTLSILIGFILNIMLVCEPPAVIYMGRDKFESSRMGL